MQDTESRKWYTGHRMAHKGEKPPTVLVALDLAYQNGRDYYTGILQHLDDAHRGWDIHLARHGLDRSTLERELAFGIDGLIFDYMADDRIISRVAAQTLPCVALDCARPDLFAARKRNLAFVDVDSYDIGRHAAEYLSRIGRYATFGTIGYETTCNWSERRIKSFTEQIAADSGKVSVLRIHRANMESPASREAIRRWIARMQRPFAVMAVCDELARLLVGVLGEMGIRIPHEVAVLGVDNEWILCTHMRPTLSSIKPDFENSGRAAAEYMERMLRRPTPVMRKIVRVREIVERESTAPSSPAGKMVAKAEEFIRDHGDENLHVGDIVRHLKISRRLLNLRFRQITGRTVIGAIRAKQLERVCALLTATTHSIGEISRLYGFRSENHLKRIFKQTFGMSMREYRNRNR